jgi:hypothetical protein
MYVCMYICMYVCMYVLLPSSILLSVRTRYVCAYEMDDGASGRLSTGPLYAATLRYHGARILATGGWPL